MAKKRFTAKQRAAQKAWVERQRRRDAWVRGEGATPLEGDHSWALTKPPGAFDNVVADMAAVRGVRFPPGHVWPPAADPLWQPHVILERRNGINCVLVPANPRIVAED